MRGLIFIFRFFCFSMLLNLSITSLIIGQETEEASKESATQSFESMSKGIKNYKDLKPEDKANLLQYIDKATRFTSEKKLLDEQLNSLKESLTESSQKIKNIENDLKNVKTKEFIPTTLEEFSLSDIEQQFKEEKNSALKLEKRLSSNEQELKELKDMIDKRQLKSAQNNKRLSELPKELQFFKSFNDNYITEVGQQVLQTEREKINKENDLLNFIQDSQLTLLRLQTSRRDLAKLKLTKQKEYESNWQSYITQRRKAENLKVAQKAKIALKEAENLNPAVKSFYDKNLKIVEQLQSINNKNHDIQKYLKTLNENLKSLNTRFDETKNQINSIYLTEVLGLALKKELSFVDEIQNFPTNIHERHKTMESAGSLYIGANSEFQKIIDIPQESQKLAALTDTPQEFEQLFLKAFQTRKDNLLKLVNASHGLFDNLRELTVLEQQINAKAKDYKSFIQGQLFWIRSSKPVNLNNVKAIPKNAVEVFSKITPKELLKVYKKTLKSDFYFHLIFIILLIVLLSSSKRLSKKIQTCANQTGHKETDSFKVTLQTFIYTLLRAIRIPLLLSYLAFSLNIDGLSSPSIQNLSYSLYYLSTVVFTLSFMIETLSENGLGIVQFKWDKDTCSKYRSIFKKWLLFVSPFIFIGLLSTRGYDIDFENLAKFGLIINLLCGIGLISYLLRKNKDFNNELKSPSLVKRYQFLLASLLLTVSFMLLLAIKGYFYTAYTFKVALSSTFLLISSLYILHKLFGRYLEIRRQREAYEKVRNELEIKHSEKFPLQHEVLIEEQELKLENSLSNIRRAYKSIFNVLLIIGLYYIWIDLFPAFNILETYSMWTSNTSGDGTTVMTITAKTLISVIVVLAFSFYLSSALPNILDVFVLSNFSFNEGQKFTGLTLLKYIIVTFGLVWSFNKLGLNWSKFQWLAAALSVGLGFGLQEIVANFISGLIVLFERPYRVGDIVTVGNTSGTVSKIHIRATTIRDWDRRELIIPNKSFITGEFINWSLSDSISRVVIEINVAFGSNIEKVKEILLNIGQGHQNALEEPPPMVVFSNIGTHSYLFELKVFVSASKYRLSTRDEILARIIEEFEKEDIKIPYPKSVLQLHTDSTKNVK